MRRVLVVEDDQILRWLMTEAVEHLGYEVSECSNADDAVVQLQGESSISLVITDVKMPGSIDGLGLAQLIWSTYYDLPVIIVSGHSVLTPGFLPLNARFLKKPCTLDELSLTISELLSSSW
ncbi:response regulator [Pseudomonas sp. SbB1]|uniref:Response regulator receiver protein n=1 Tax=Pseudomonas putida (strain GB-1) TaxID=76869 RepID=B0KFF8_PSEPG|nr:MULTISPECIES: response regulator [Pseudomonas]ABY98881.1 response regulator receiver protein [Pseudomonas putida GB-1]MBP0708911.1 response regulator [Pseudomonas sp. T34]MCK2188348.1 response regulator [Pseudomonas sp. MB04B]MDD2083963.1 response regulator [Pseudomonas putida]MDD2093135.1 response regulator [Pseudomonas putida]